MTVTKFPLPSVALNPQDAEVLVVADHLYVGVGAMVTVTRDAPKEIRKTQRYISNKYEIKEAFIVPVDVAGMLYVAQLFSPSGVYSESTWFWSDPPRNSRSYVYYDVSVMDPNVHLIEALV